MPYKYNYIAIPFKSNTAALYDVLRLFYAAALSYHKTTILNYAFRQFTAILLSNNSIYILFPLSVGEFLLSNKLSESYI